MFADAYKLASQFTKPVVTSVRHVDGSVNCSLASFVIVNQEGWVVTAAHVFEPLAAYEMAKPGVADHHAQTKAIEADPKLTSKQRAKAMRKLRPDPKWIISHSMWWGADALKAEEIHVVPEIDLAVVRLAPWDASRVSHYPVIKNPALDMDVGTSLCKLGYPFHVINATYDEKLDRFALAPGTLPVPRFPLEGIYTRNGRFGKTRDGKYNVWFIETSSPGLRGQSGGPIFDSRGTVWAIQSRTAHLPLGFSPTVQENGKKYVEQQFLNVGLGVHADPLAALLRDLGVSFALSEY